MVELYRRKQEQVNDNIEVAVNRLTQESYAADISGGSTVDNYTDTGCSLELVPGIYSVIAFATIHIANASSGGYLVGALALTDNSNNVIEAIAANGAGTALDGAGDDDIGSAFLKYELTVTTTTTYKTRFGAFQASGDFNTMSAVYTVSPISKIGGNGSIRLIAKRIDNVKIKDLK